MSSNTKTTRLRNWKLDLAVFVVLMMFAWCGTFGIAGILAHVAPTEDVEVRVIGRELSAGIEFDAYYLTIALPDGAERRLTVTEEVHEDTPLSGFARVSLRHSTLLGTPIAVLFRRKTMLEHGWIKPGSILDTSTTRSEDVPETEVLPLLLAWPIYLLCAVAGWGSVIWLLVHALHSARRRNQAEVRCGWIAAALVMCSVALVGVTL